jgi:hypothetical protein
VVLLVLVGAVVLGTPETDGGAVAALPWPGGEPLGSGPVWLLHEAGSGPRATVSAWSSAPHGPNTPNPPASVTTFV